MLLTEIDDKYSVGLALIRMIGHTNCASSQGFPCTDNQLTIAQMLLWYSFISPVQSRIGLSGPKKTWNKDLIP